MSEGILSNPQQWTILTPLRAASAWWALIIRMIHGASPAYHRLCDTLLFTQDVVLS